MLLPKCVNFRSGLLVINKHCTPKTTFFRARVADRASKAAGRRVHGSSTAHGGSTTSQQEVADDVEVVVGIDLGTTNSVVAHIVNGKPVCIANELGDTLTPSVVSFLPDGSTLVGRAAKNQNPQTTYYSVKRLIGRSWADPAVQEERERLAYAIDQDSEGNVVLDCPHVEPGCLYPEEVSACVLAQLLEDAAQHTGTQQPITKAVITVPAYFNDEQREATISAGKLAGLETVRLIREPVAAALAYGLDLTEEQVVLVFDLGGGTFDVSLLEVGNGTIEVLSTGGDGHLGGDDWDAAIVSWLREQFLDPAGVDSSNPVVAAKLKALAEYAKVTLSDNDQVTLRMPIGGPNGGPLSVNLDQSTLDGLSTELFRRLRLPLDQACWSAGVDLNELQMTYAAKKEEMARKGVAQWKQEMLKLEIRPRARAAVSKVLLVGGATRMPAVQRFITNMTGLVPESLESGVDPDEAVALGAAVQAGILQGQVDSLMVMDQWQASLMRALAQLQLKTSTEVRARVEQQFDIDDDEGLDPELLTQQEHAADLETLEPPAVQEDEVADSITSRAGSASSSSSSSSARGSGRQQQQRQQTQQKQQQQQRKQSIALQQPLVGSSEAFPDPTTGQLGAAYKKKGKNQRKN